MLKAEILKTLRRLGRATLSEIVKELPWQGIHSESVRRYLLEFKEAGLVYVLNADTGMPIYRLTKKGEDLVTFVISHVEEYGKVGWDHFASNPYLEELAEIAIELGIIEEKHGLLSIITTGCGELPSGRAVSGILCPNDHFVEVDGSTMPENITCPYCGERLKHVGQGKYVVAKMIKETVIDQILAIIDELDRKVSDRFGLPRINDWRPAMPHEGPFFMPARLARALWPNGWLRRVFFINPA
jgi:DNA-binding transcriptional ArsR family regulator